MDDLIRDHWQRELSHREPRFDCWARCEPCGVDFPVGVTVPCAVDVYCAALRLVRCPTCGKQGKNLLVYEPGRKPIATVEQR